MITSAPSKNRPQSLPYKLISTAASPHPLFPPRQLTIMPARSNPHDFPERKGSSSEEHHRSRLQRGKRGSDQGKPYTTHQFEEMRGGGKDAYDLVENRLISIPKDYDDAYLQRRLPLFYDAKPCVQEPSTPRLPRGGANPECAKSSQQVCEHRNDTNPTPITCRRPDFIIVDGTGGSECSDAPVTPCDPQRGRTSERKHVSMVGVINCKERMHDLSERLAELERELIPEYVVFDPLNLFNRDTPSVEVHKIDSRSSVYRKTVYQGGEVVDCSYFNYWKLTAEQLLDYRYIRRLSKRSLGNRSVVVADCNDLESHNGKYGKFARNEKKTVILDNAFVPLNQGNKGIVQNVREATKKVSEFNKELYQDAMHALQEAKELTRQTEELEDLVRLPCVRRRENWTPQLIDRGDPAGPSKRGRSDRRFEAESQSRDRQKRHDNDRMIGSSDTEISRKGKGASFSVRRLTREIADDNQEPSIDPADILQQAKRLTQQNNELENIVRLPGRSQGFRFARPQVVDSESSKQSANRYRLDCSVSADLYSRGMLVRNDKPRSCENEDALNQDITLVQKVRESTRQETHNGKELYQEAMEALNLATELSRQTKELENLVQLPKYTHRKRLAKPITLTLDTAN